MKLSTRCSFCKSEISFNSMVNDRVELEMKKGKTFSLTCDNCHKKDTYHVNDFVAHTSLSHKLFLIGIVLGSILTILYLEKYVLTLGFFFYGGIFLVPSIAYAIVSKQYRTKLNSFNRFKVKD